MRGSTEPEPDDSELLRRMDGGDEAALGVFYDRWSATVHSVVLQILGDTDDTEEVIEEVFWQVWRQCGRYEPERGAVSTWLLMVARSRALDRVRARKRVREERWSELPEPSDAALPGPAPMTPLGDAVAAERNELVADAVRSLPPEQREAVQLAYFGGLSQSEIAEQTGQPLGTIKTRTRLALRKLRERLSFLREETP